MGSAPWARARIRAECCNWRAAQSVEAGTQLSVIHVASDLDELDACDGGATSCEVRMRGSAPDPDCSSEEALRSRPAGHADALGIG